MTAIEGRARECLRHYLSGLPWEEAGCVEARKPIIEFIGVNSDTVRSWHTGQFFPIGLALIKTYYFLEKEGYRVSELEALGEVTYNLGKLMAFNVIDCEDVALQLDLTARGKIFLFLRGERCFSPEREGKAKIILNLYKDELDGLPKRLLPEKAVKEKKVERVQEKSEELVEVKELFNLLVSLNGLTEVLLPRLELVLSERFSPEERRVIRERAGRKLVFDLSNKLHGVYKAYKVLNALCSEKARELMKNDIETNKERRIENEDDREE